MNAMTISNPAPGGRILAGLRAVATPLTIGTFLLCGGTGLALFLDGHGHALKALHEWSGLALLGAVALHLLRNWRPTVQQFTRWPVWMALGAAAIAAVWMLAVAPAGGPRHERHDGAGRPEGLQRGGERGDGGREPGADHGHGRGHGDRAGPRGE